MKGLIGAANDSANSALVAPFGLRIDDPSMFISITYFIMFTDRNGEQTLRGQSPARPICVPKVKVALVIKKKKKEGRISIK